MATSLANRNLSKLKWIKVISDDSGWAYTRDRLKEMPQGFDCNGVTVFPLGFRTEKAAKIESGDQLALIQKGKLTHIVEVIDRQLYKGGGWYHRVCRVLWWEPKVNDWQNLRPQKELLGFDPALQDGDPHAIETLKRFGDRWNENGDVAGFRDFLEARL